MRANTNVYSKKAVIRPSKQINDINSFTHTVMQITQDISPKGDPSPQHLTFSMALSYTGIPGKDQRHSKSVTMKKQVQHMQMCYKRTGLKTFTY